MRLSDTRGPGSLLKGDGIPEHQKWKHPTAYSFWGDEERIAIERVLDSGQFTMAGEMTAFEREFADWHGRAHGVMVNSGSSANLVATAALFHVKHRPLKRGRQALVPAIAWSTTYAPLVQHGLDLVLMDVVGSWNVDLYDHAPPFDADKIGLIVGCSILGCPAELAGLKSAAGVLDAWFLEDNCESLGAVTPQGKLCGTYGDLSTFSFFWSHQISAIEGGMILTDDDELAGLCRMLRAHGWSRDVEPPTSFEAEYDFRLFGYNVRPLEINAAVARAQLKKLPGFVAARRANLEAFRKAVDGLPVQVQETAGEPSPFGLAFEVLAGPSARQRLAEALRARGTDCRLPTGGSFRLHPYGAPWRGQETPRADEIHRRGLFLGNGPFDMAAEIDVAARAIREVF